MQWMWRSRGDQPMAERPAIRGQPGHAGHTFVTGYDLDGAARSARRCIPYSSGGDITMRKMLAALIGAAATVTMITGAGVASASPARPGSPAHPVTITHPASAHRAVTGIEHFQAVSTSPTSRRSQVAAYGVVHAHGVSIAHRH